MPTWVLFKSLVLAFTYTIHYSIGLTSFSPSRTTLCGSHSYGAVIGTSLCTLHTLVTLTLFSRSCTWPWKEGQCHQSVTKVTPHEGEGQAGQGIVGLRIGLWIERQGGTLRGYIRCRVGKAGWEHCRVLHFILKLGFSLYFAYNCNVT